MNTKTAILIFANSAKKEAERKSFLSAEIFSALNAKTLNTVKKTKLPFFIFSEKEQIGHNFGERFSNAIAAVFKKGFKNVITIGNDTPHLKSSHLVDTKNQLEQNDLILGPSKDGGFYLMGISKENFSKENFLKLPWQTNKLNSYITSLANAKNLKISFLEPLQDLDSEKDIQLIINSFKDISLSILKLLQELIFRIKEVSFKQFLTYLNKVFSPNSNKGSPVAFS